MNQYVNCPKCHTYQPFGRGVCQICGAALDVPSSNGTGTVSSPMIPPAPQTPIISVGAPQEEYTPPPTMSIEDYIAQHKIEVQQQEAEEASQPQEEEEGGLPVYALVGQNIVDLIINLDWFEDECFPANPQNMNQDWAKNHYFVPITRLDDLYGHNEV